MKIRIENVKAVLDGNPILKGISFDVGEKEFIGIIGPNGSGKSTLLKCIYRILQPTSGAVYLDGELLSQMKHRESAKRMAVVAQHSQYNFDFRVSEIVLMGRAPYKRSMERDNAQDYEIMREALKKVDMLDFADRNFSTLSGGEQQRVVLARALTQQTRCLILDEPTNHLDIKYQLQLLDTVKATNLTVLAAIHDLNIAAMYCDRVFILFQGEIIAFGRPEEVLTRGLIREVYGVDATVLHDEEGVMHILYKPRHAVLKEQRNLLK